MYNTAVSLDSLHYDKISTGKWLSTKLLLKSNKTKLFTSNWPSALLVLWKMFSSLAWLCFFIELFWKISLIMLTKSWKYQQLLLDNMDG